MKKKVEFNLILGILLLAFGLISTSYSIITVIIKTIFGHFGIIVYVKDMLFDLVFLLLGLILIRKKKSKNSRKMKVY